VGVAKGLDVQQSVAKAKADAKKHIIIVPRIDNRTIPHEVSAKYSAAHVLIKPASIDHGVRAGGSVRFVLELAGIKDATAKCLGRTPNKLTNAMAAITALSKMKQEKPRPRKVEAPAAA
jgi:small subunit ribosomal protein S5